MSGPPPEFDATPERTPADPPDTLSKLAECELDPTGDRPTLFKPSSQLSPTLLPGQTPVCDRDSFVLNPPQTAPKWEGIQLPGYEILGVLGRGGMGVVYKARHLTLDRLVALKMILAGAHASPDQLARFRTEAQAEARLHHPHIVQVYEIGERDGLPYFSLEYVEGGSLARLLAHQPQPARDAAQFMETVARAMAYAHQQGVIHRDLKPANILLSGGPEMPPEAGPGNGTGLPASSRLADRIPKIADFGLAKRFREDPSQTTTGTLLGTPTYMSPEQASARNRDVGPASDQYTLGAILYEMLIGRPPVQGVTMVETLALVGTQEPVPPRQLQPSIPADLETICLKCLQKDPTQRYADCTALADDLRRYLNGEPIQARPVGSVERLWRWCKRNPRTAVLSGSVFLLLLAISVASASFALLLDRKQQETEAARRNAVANEELAEQRAREASAARDLARKRFDLAVHSLEIVVHQVQSQLEDIPATHQVRRDILEAALKVLQEATVNSDGTGLSERGMVQAHLKLGEVLWELDKRQEGVDQFRLAWQLAERLSRESPQSDKAAGNYGVTLIKQGDLQRDLRRDYSAARRYYEQALHLQEEAANHPRGKDWPHEEVLQSIAGTEERLADLAFRQSNFPEAEERTAHALQLREAQYQHDKGAESRRALASSYYNCAKLEEQHNRRQEALKRHEQALRLREDLAKEQRQRTQFKQDLIASHAALGDLHLFSGEPRQAREHYQALLAPAEQLASLFDTPRAQRDLSYQYYRVGTAALRLGEPALADDYYQKCLKIREQLATRQESTTAQEIDLMIARARCGLHEMASAAAKSLTEKFPKDPRVLVQAAYAFALCGAAVVHGRSPATLAPADQALRNRYFEQSVAALKQARANGYRAVKDLESDPDLDPIRGHEPFEEFMRDFKYAATEGKRN